MKWYIGSLTRKYFDFKGRAGPAEYWLTLLIHWAITIFLFGLIYLTAGNETLLMISAALMAIYFVATTIPMLAVLVRRLHDTGRSGFVMFVSLVPFGSFILLVWLLEKTHQQPNQFGPPPGSMNQPAGQSYYQRQQSAHGYTPGSPGTGMR